MANAFNERRDTEENPTTRHKKAHERSDTDASAGAQHHTIGDGPYQAASGRKLKQLLARMDALEDRVAYLETRDHTH